MKSKINKLVIDLVSTGHHTIFIKYVSDYIINLNLNNNDNYIIVISENCKPLFNNARMPANIHLLFIEQSNINKINKGNILIKSLRNTRFVKDLVSKYNIHQVLLLCMNIYQFGLLCYNFKNVKIRGIIFSQYFRQNKNSIKGSLRYYKRKEMLKILVKKKYVEKVFFLNDDSGVRKEAARLKTNKLFSVPDPVERFNIKNLIDIRSIENIPQNHKIFLHYGSLAERKGSLLILEALEILPVECYNRFTLIFAGGSPNKSLEGLIHFKLMKLKNRGIQIIYYNYFIEKIQTQSLFFYSDYCLCPYTSVEASSGSVGLSIAGKTKIIGPKEGLLGEIIRNTGMGIQLEKVDKIELCKTIQYCIEEDHDVINCKINIEARSPISFSKRLIFD